jgi:protein ImuA
MSQLVAELRARLRGAGRCPTPVGSGGIPVWDGWSPSAGVAAGSSIEWLTEPGSGALDLAYGGVAAALASGKQWCVIDACGTFSALPALAEMVTDQCLVVRPATVDDAWWAVEQALRCPGVALTWCWLDHLPERVARRWKVAAEAGGGVGVWFRPPAARRQSSWADLRLLVTPQPSPQRTGRTVRIDVIYRRGGVGGEAVVLEIEHATRAVRVVSELADPALAVRRTPAPRPAARRVC